MGGDLPTPRARHAARSRKLNARFENGASEYPANTNCDPAPRPASTPGQPDAKGRDSSLQTDSAMHYLIQGRFGIIRSSHSSLRRLPSAGRLSFANHPRRLLVIAHGDKSAMTQVPSICPFEECDLADGLRFNPAALVHFLFG
jgi:hypothetical protein